MTYERARKIKLTVFDNYYDQIERLSEGFNGKDEALNFGRVLGLMEGDLVRELDEDIRRSKKKRGE